MENITYNDYVESCKALQGNLLDSKAFDIVVNYNVIMLNDYRKRLANANEKYINFILDLNLFQENGEFMPIELECLLADMGDYSLVYSKSLPGCITQGSSRLEALSYFFIAAIECLVVRYHEGAPLEEEFVTNGINLYGASRETSTYEDLLDSMLKRGFEIKLDGNLHTILKHKEWSYVFSIPKVKEIQHSTLLIYYSIL